MKKFYSLLIVVFFTITAMSQTTHWTGAVNTDWQNAGNWDNGVPNTNTEFAIFNTGTTLTVTNAPTVTLGSLTVTANTNLTLSHTSARTLTMANSAGTDFTIDAGSQLTMGTNINITLANSATATVDGTLTVTTGRTYNTNGGGTVKTTVSGTIDNSGTVTCTNAGKLSFLSGSTYIHAEDGGNIPTATWNAASTVEVTGYVATLPTGFDTQTLGNLLWNSSGQTGSNTPNVLTIGGNLTVQNTGTGEFRFGDPGTNTIAGNYSQSAGIARIGSNTARTVTVTGDFSLSGGTLDMSTGNQVGTLNVAGDLSISGGTISESGTSSGAINFSGASAQAFSKTSGTISNVINFTINNGAIVDFGTSVLNGSTGTFTLSAGGKINTANAGGIPSTITVSGIKTYNSGADYEFQGTSTGVFTTSPTASTVRNLTVNNSTGNVTLAQPLAVTGALALTSGALTTTTTNIVTINAGGTTSGSSFVDGPMAKVGNTAFTFPVGKVGAGLRTVGISAPSASSTIRAEFFRADPHTFSSTYAAGISQISGCEYWTLSRTAGAGTGRVILSWAAGSTCSGANYVTNMATLKVARLNAGTWNDDGFLSTTGTNTAGTLTANLTSAFSFTFALATNGGGNPLPVMFGAVKAYEKNSGVQIEWNNLTERDLVNYFVERSTNGQDFTSIDQQLPRSNRNDAQSYSTFDASPYQGTNFYRIKVLEISGKIIYSKILKVDIGGKQQGFTLYPNPVSGGQVSVSFNVKQGQYTLKVLNTSGQEVYSQKINHQGGSMTQAIQLPSSVKPGFYNMMISGENYRESKMFVVQ